MIKPIKNIDVYSSLVHVLYEGRNICIPYGKYAPSQDTPEKLKTSLKEQEN